MSHDLTRIVEFEKYDNFHQPYRVDQFFKKYSVSTRPPLGKSDRLVFKVKSTNKDRYHRIVYSYSKRDWDGSRDTVGTSAGT